MKLNQLTSGLLMLGTVNALVPSTRQTEIEWSACNRSISSLGSIPVFCAKLPVPLDYHDGSGETVDLDLIKVNAVRKPAKGTLIFNFGGPGGRGIAPIASESLRLLQATGGHYNLLSFDPRGVGSALPFSCYDSSGRRLAASSRNPENWANASSTAVGRIWADSKIEAEECYAAQGDRYGELVGTAFVARDMMQIVDALKEDGLLNYWGISYGTILGATAAALFPDRMGKIILDGVVNPFQYYRGNDEDWVDTMDESAAGFFSGCVDNPDNCILSRYNMSATELESAFYDFFEELKYDPITVGSWIVDYSLAKALFFSLQYDPSVWPETAVVLHYLYTRDTEPLLELLQYVSSPDQEGPNESFYGIMCGDKGITNETLAEEKEVLEQDLERSRWFGDGLFSQKSICAQWKMEAKEIYEGDFNVSTKTPLLVIGNAYDPVTPLISAKNLTETIPGSVLVEQRGYGHSSLVQNSYCTRKIVHAYLNDGELPESGTVCPVDDTLFSPKTDTLSMFRPKLKVRRR